MWLVRPTVGVVGDTTGSRIEGDEVHDPPGFREAYKQYAAAGWRADPSRRHTTAAASRGSSAS